MNRTERRRLYVITGLDPPSRTLSDEALSEMVTPHVASNQARIRVKVQTFVQANWVTLRETLNCNGDCAGSSNTCSDAQAAACYLTNRDSVDP